MHLWKGRTHILICHRKWVSLTRWICSTRRREEAKKKQAIVSFHPLLTDSRQILIISLGIGHVISPFSNSADSNQLSLFSAFDHVLKTNYHSCLPPWEFILIKDTIFYIIIIIIILTVVRLQLLSFCFESRLVLSAKWNSSRRESPPTSTVHSK
jgi:hypothetical protein